MKKFSEFQIKRTHNGLQGDKIKMERILNREIAVHGYSIENSKFEGKGKCIYLQISINGTMHVVFSSSKGLMADLEQIPKDNFPFLTTIIKDNDRLIFS